MKIIKIQFFTGIVLAAASFATCYFGVKHLVEQIPPEIRRGMTDTDWIGIEWIGPRYPELSICYRRPFLRCRSLAADEIHFEGV
jgi:hypothetical protein